MIFTEEEQLEIKKISDKNPLVKRLWEEYDKYQQDPTAEYYLAVVEMSKALAGEMNSVMSPKKEIIDGKTVTIMDAPILLSEDKLFERIKSLLTDNEKIFSGIAKGKQELNKGDQDINKKDAEKAKKLAKGSDIAV